MRALLAAAAAFAWIQLYAPAALAQSADFKAPAIGTRFEWKYNGGVGRPGEIVGVSGRVVTYQDSGGIRHRYGGFQQMESSRGENLRLDISELDKLWPLSVGKSVSVQAQYGQYASQIEIRVVKQEKITIPAGTFDAFEIEADERTIGSGYGYSGTTLSWFVPSVGYALKWDYRQTGGQNAGVHSFGEVSAIHAPK